MIPRPGRWLVVLLACGALTCGCARTVAGQAVPVSLSPTAITGLAGTWTGGYICAQGATDLTLQLRASDPLTGVAEFRVGDGAANAGTQGSFAVTVQPEADHAVRLHGGEWVSRPDPGWSVVDFVALGVTSYDTDTLQGRVEGTGCSEFSVRRTNTS